MNSTQPHTELLTILWGTDGGVGLCPSVMTEEELRHRSVFDVSADSARGESAKAGERQLRCGLETIRNEPCLGEYVTFDVSGDGLRILFRHLGLVDPVFEEENLLDVRVHVPAGQASEVSLVRPWCTQSA